VLVEGIWRTVVGVVTSSVKPTPFRQDPGEIFIPVAQSTAAGDVRLLVRTSRPLDQVAPAVRAAVRAADRDQPVADLRTLEEELDRFMTPFRLILGLTLAFSGVAVLLAAVGLYGVLAHSVARRTREMGVRIALGASRSRVLRTILGDGFRLAVVGLAVGLLPGLAVTRILPAALFGVGGLSSWHVGAVVVVWLGVALGACLPPARRAAGVEPVAALRCE
jgi:putative ABC transport system permease protein